MSPLIDGDCYWMSSDPETDYPALTERISAGGCVVGAGMTGLLTACPRSATSPLCAAPCELLRGTGVVSASWNTALSSKLSAWTTRLFRGPTFAFITATELRQPDASDSVCGAFAGECSCDARTLAVCRG